MTCSFTSGTFSKTKRCGRSISTRYRYIMVDEYQDTNGVQAEIIRLLAKRNGNIMAVGDDAQSIYGFRGANHRNILRFPEIFPGCKGDQAGGELPEHASPSSTWAMRSSTNMRHKFDKRLVSAAGVKGNKPSLRRFEDIYQEALWVAERVRTFTQGGPHEGDRGTLSDCLIPPCPSRPN